MSSFISASICVSPSVGTVVVGYSSGFQILTNLTGTWAVSETTTVTSLLQMVCSASQIYVGSGSLTAYVLSGYSPGSGAQVWTLNTWPGPQPDTAIEPRLDSSGNVGLIAHSNATDAATWSMVTVSDSGAVLGSAAFTPYVSSVAFYPYTYFPYFSISLIEGTSSIWFCDNAKVANWNVGNQQKSNVDSALTTAASLPPYFASLIASSIASANAQAEGLLWGSNWAAVMRGWVDCAGGSVPWVARAPGLSCYSLEPSGITKAWETTSQSGNPVILYTVLGATNGNIVAYKEVHTWIEQPYQNRAYPTMNSSGEVVGVALDPFAQQAAYLAAIPPLVYNNVVSDSHYYLVLIDGSGAEIANLEIFGYGPKVPCQISAGFATTGISGDQCVGIPFGLLTTATTPGICWSSFNGVSTLTLTPVAPGSTGGVTTSPYSVFTNGYLVPKGFGPSYDFYSGCDETVAYSGTSLIAGITTSALQNIQFTLPPEPNLNLSEFATDGALIYLVSGQLTELLGSSVGTNYLPYANQEQVLRVYAYSATTLTLAWSVVLPITVGPGTTAKILFLGAHLHVLAYDGTATTHFWLDPASGDNVGPLESVGSTNPAQAFTATAGQLALAYGSTVRIYQD